MPVYKDDSSGSWYAQFYFTDWTGERKKKLKRGFATKKEAQTYESEYKRKACADMSMQLGSFVDVYFKDKAGELKERTIRNKKYMIDTHVIPYLGTRNMNEIKPSDIIDWQNTIRNNNDFSNAYLRMLQNQMTAIFSHAQKIYGLENNPCKRVKKMGNFNERSLNFWTEDEYRKFIATYEVGSMHYVMFEILFWTGCRIGELLALTADDFNIASLQMSITKTYFRHNGQDIITTPKTDSSIRTIDLPDFLVKEVSDYINRRYKCPGSERLFPIGAEAVQHTMKHHIAKAGVKKIRVHDLRHSHAAYLIHLGVQPLIIKERLGHKDIKITLNTYGHLYPSEQKKVAGLLDKTRREFEDKISEVTGNG